ncbi:MAG: hypothetical protein AMXMBFR61_08540 [Fimbriimonadales bacterium]
MRAWMIAAALTLFAIVPAFAVEPLGIVSGMDYVEVVIYKQFLRPQHFWNGVITTGGFRVYLDRT